MKKPENAHPADDDLEIPELGPEFFQNAVQGRFHEKVMARSNVVRIAPDVTEAFPNEAAVNHALREMLRFRQAITEITATKTKRRRTA